MSLVACGWTSLGKGADKSIEMLRGGCKANMNAEEAKPFLVDLRNKGAVLLDELIRFANGPEPAGCRAIAAEAVCEYAQKDSSLTARVIDGLSPLLGDPNLRDTVFFSFAQFGEAANDSLIALLESKDEAVRGMSFNDLAVINLKQVEKNRELRMYDPAAPEEERRRVVKLWREWWAKAKHGSGSHG